MEFLTQHIENLMTDGGTIDNRQIRELCKENGVDLDLNISKVKESVELGLMRAARYIVQSEIPLRQKYDNLIDIYNRQPYVGTKKTLKQMVLQQYSTPLPIAFLMSEFVKSKSNSALYFEPSAGNGFLTIALPQENTICNEIDRYRLENLRSEHYRKVTEQDGRQKFEYDHIFDGVVTNPPFIKEIDTMIFNALDTMKDNGRCAILRDGLNEFEPYYGTLHRRKFVGFYDRLFQEYNVVKIINLNSKKIYAKQGTAFFMHIILIDGRRAQKGSDDETIHRVFNPEIDKTELAGFDELWEYFSPYISENEITTSDVFDERETMRMAFNHLIKELGEDEGREVFEWYCKTYNVGISDIMPSTVKWEIFGTDKTFREIDKIRKSKSDKVSPLLELELQLAIIENQNTSRKLSESDRHFLESIGISKDDFIWIEDAIPNIDFKLKKIEEGENAFKKVSFENAVKLLGRYIILSGVRRATFHYTSTRQSNGYECYMEDTNFFSGLGSLTADFIIEYHIDGGVFYDLDTARKNGKVIKAAIYGTDITTNVSVKDTDFEVAQKLLKCEYEYVIHGLTNKYKILEKNEIYRVVFTKYSYICSIINNKLEIIRRYDTDGNNGISGIYATNIERPRHKGQFGNYSNIQGQQLYATEIGKHNLQSKTSNRINVIKNYRSAFQGTRPTQIGGINGLTESQWTNFLAQKEDWRAFQWVINETPYHNNVVIVRKPSNGGNGYIQYWLHLTKGEIESNTKIIDRIFGIIIDKFPDWKTKDPIITYRPHKDTLNKNYYIFKRELRFTPKEGDKFLQVIPFFLKMYTITPEQLKFEDSSFYNLKYCKFKKVDSEISPLLTLEMELLKDVSLSERIRLNFTDAPEKVVKNLINNSWIIATSDVKKHLRAINIKDVMWDLLAEGNYNEETENYIKNKSKDSKDKMLPKWVNIIYDYLCDKHGIEKIEW